MRRLPKIYHSNNNKVNTNKEMCVVEEIETLDENVQEILQKVYAGLGNNYNTNVYIETKDNVYNTSLIYKSKDQLITKDNAVIKVADIKKIIIKK